MKIDGRLQIFDEAARQSSLIGLLYSSLVRVAFMGYAPLRQRLLAVHVPALGRYGNFHMKPNGVFYISVDGAAVAETGAFLKQRPRATA